MSYYDAISSWVHGKLLIGIEFNEVLTMKKCIHCRWLIPTYILAIGGLLLTAVLGSRAITTVSEHFPITARKCVVIDAGHGGEDGGAVSYTGVYESQINLQIALRLEDLMHLLGIDTVMIRSTDCSVYTKGDTLASKKVSDLKERVRITNATENAVLVSIHQNQFAESRYSGAQVFFASTQGSEDLAQIIQRSFIQTLNPGSKRQIKKANGIYLMQHIQCTGVLVECGFISNPEEEAKLRSTEYQQKISCILASACSQYLNGTSA